MAEITSWLPPRWLPPVEPSQLADGSRFFSGCSYAIETGYRPMQLDVRVPVSDRPVPVIVWIHGGGYNMGDRRSTPDPVRFGRLFDSVVDCGFALVSIDYRLGLEAVFPAAVHDAKAALRWLARYADQLGIDASRVGLWGESAGGHLAGFVAATQGSSEFEGELGLRGAAARIKAFVGWYGGMDLESIVRPSITPEIEAMMGGKVPDFMRLPPEYYNLGADRYLDPSARRMASPMTYASAAMPATLLIHGEVDRMVPIQQSEVMTAKLRSVGADVEFVRIANADHVWQGVDQATIDNIIEQSIDFFIRQLHS